MKPDKKQISQKIKQAALDLGFQGCGICAATQLDYDAGLLKNWLKHGMHAEMQYMENHFEKRVSPEKLVSGAKSVVCVFLNYFPENTQAHADAPVLSKYAYGTDYHFLMKKKLLELLKTINNEIAPANGRAFVDSAPLLERALAREAGLGWIGKNTNLINPKFGSFIFLGELVIDLEAEYDKPMENKCGKCTKCIDACPTKALVQPNILDSRKCISYLSIEKKGDIPTEFSGRFLNRVFGCDICQDVCPFNKNAVPHNITELKPKQGLLNMEADDWHNIDNESFSKVFAKSPVKRAKFSGLKRNLDFLRANSEKPL